MEIPVYLVAGFLDAGKTSFINDNLINGFARDERTLLLCCEDGDETYVKNALDNVTVITVDDEEELTSAYLKQLENTYHPQQVMIEYNGMWQLEKLYRDILPANWLLYQIMTIVYAPGFEVMVRNMGQLMMEKITNADMIVFNRCTPELAKSLRERNLRMVNRRADMYLEYENGESENYLLGDECPFDLSQDKIDIPDEDFGVWYVDAMDHPEHYEGKNLHMKAMMCLSKKYPGTYVPGRFAMVCCANDTQFLGVVAKGSALKPYRNRDWIEFTAQFKKEYFPAYQGDGPVLYVTDVHACAAPAEEVVTF